MPRLFICLFIAGAFVLWSPLLRADTALNKDCDGVTPVGGALAPMHDSNGAGIRSAGQTPNVRCQNQMTPKFGAPAHPAAAVPNEKSPAPAPAETPAEEEHHGAHLDMDEEGPTAAPNHNPWMSPPQEDPIGGDHWRYQD